MMQPISHRTMPLAAALCFMTAACGNSPEDRLASCRAVGIADPAALERCRQSDAEKDAVIAVFNVAKEEVERKKAAEEALKREEELRRKAQQDMARRKEECNRLIREFSSVTPVSEEAGAKATEQFELAEMERNEGYFGKCIDYALYATNLAKGQ